MCPRCRAGVRGSGRPAFRRPAQRLRRLRARPAADRRRRRRPCGGRPGRGAAGACSKRRRSSPSRVWAATISAATRATTRPWPRLRERKRRPAKSVGGHVRVARRGRRALRDRPRRRPRELAQPAAPDRRPPRGAGRSGLSALISPGHRTTSARSCPTRPLHICSCARVSPLVMTSGNLSEEPIAKDEDELPRAPRPGRRLRAGPRPPDRPPVRRLRPQDRRRASALFLRRSRGCVPDPIPLPRRAGRPCWPAARSARTPSASRAATAPSSRSISATCTDYAAYRVLRGGGRRTCRALLRGRPAGGGARPAPRLPFDPLCAARCRGVDAWPSSTTTPTSPRAWRSTGSTGRSSAWRWTARATARTVRSGAASSWSPTWPATGAPGTSSATGCPAARRRSAIPRAWR